MQKRKTVPGFTTTSDKRGESALSSRPSAVGVNAQRAFTMIEVMVVVSIIALLSTTVLASLAYAGQRSRDAKRISDMKQIQSALELYASEHRGVYPIVATSYAFQLAPVLVPQYIRQMPEDPNRTGTNRYRYYTVSATDASSYSMVVNLESDDPAVDWCLVKLGVGYTAWNIYPACDL